MLSATHERAARTRTGNPWCGLRGLVLRIASRVLRDRGCGRGAMLRAPVYVRETGGRRSRRSGRGLLQDAIARHGSVSIRAVRPALPGFARLFVGRARLGNRALPKGLRFSFYVGFLAAKRGGVSVLSVFASVLSVFLGGLEKIFCRVRSSKCGMGRRACEN